jgi:hypothetical protein
MAGLKCLSEEGMSCKRARAGKEDTAVCRSRNETNHPIEDDGRNDDRDCLKLIDQGCRTEVQGAAMTEM